jgi:hypothetical protein
LKSKSQLSLDQGQEQRFDQLKSFPAQTFATSFPKKKFDFWRF